MFSFFKKIAKSFLRFFKKPKKTVKSRIKSINYRTLFSGFLSKNEQKTNQNSDFFKEISLLILKEFGFGKYINLALGFAKLLK